VHAEHVVVVSEEDVEQEQLTDGVDAVHQLDEDVTTRQIVAVQSARHADAVTRQQLASARQTAGPTVSTSHQVTIQQVNSESLFPQRHYTRTRTCWGPMSKRKGTFTLNAPIRTDKCVYVRFLKPNSLRKCKKYWLIVL